MLKFLGIRALHFYISSNFLVFQIFICFEFGILKYNNLNGICIERKKQQFNLMNIKFNEK